MARLETDTQEIEDLRYKMREIEQKQAGTSLADELDAAREANYQLRQTITGLRVELEESMEANRHMRREIGELREHIEGIFPRPDMKRTHEEEEGSEDSFNKEDKEQAGSFSNRSCSPQSRPDTKDWVPRSAYENAERAKNDLRNEIVVLTNQVQALEFTLSDKAARETYLKNTIERLRLQTSQEAQQVRQEQTRTSKVMDEDLTSHRDLDNMSIEEMKQQLIIQRKATSRWETKADRRLAHKIKIEAIKDSLEQKVRRLERDVAQLKAQLALGSNASYGNETSDSRHHDTDDSDARSTYSRKRSRRSTPRPSRNRWSGSRNREDLPPMVRPKGSADSNRTQPLSPVTEEANNMGNGGEGGIAPLADLNLGTLKRSRHSDDSAQEDREGDDDERSTKTRRTDRSKTPSKTKGDGKENDEHDCSCSSYTEEQADYDDNSDIERSQTKNNEDSAGSAGEDRRDRSRSRRSRTDRGTNQEISERSRSRRSLRSRRSVSSSIQRPQQGSKKASTESRGSRRSVSSSIPRPRKHSQAGSTSDRPKRLSVSPATSRRDSMGDSSRRQPRDPPSELRETTGRRLRRRSHTPQTRGRDQAHRAAPQGRRRARSMDARRRSSPSIPRPWRKDKRPTDKEGLFSSGQENASGPSPVISGRTDTLGVDKDERVTDDDSHLLSAQYGGNAAGQTTQKWSEMQDVEGDDEDGRVLMVSPMPPGQTRMVICVDKNASNELEEVMEDASAHTNTMNTQQGPSSNTQMKNLSRNEDEGASPREGGAVNLSRDSEDGHQTRGQRDGDDIVVVDDDSHKEDGQDQEETMDIVDDTQQEEGGASPEDEIQQEGGNGDDSPPQEEDEELPQEQLANVYFPGLGSETHIHCPLLDQRVRRPPHRFEDIVFTQLEDMHGESERPERLEQKWHGGSYPGGPAECLGKDRCILTHEEQKGIEQWNPAAWIDRANNLPKNDDGEISTEAFLVGAAMTAMAIKRDSPCYCQNFCSACTLRVPMTPEEGKEMQRRRRVSQGQAPEVKNGKAWKGESTDWEILPEGLFRFQFYAIPKTDRPLWCDAVKTSWVTGNGKNNANRQKHSKAFWSKHTRASAFGIKKVHDRQKALATKQAQPGAQLATEILQNEGGWRKYEDGRADNQRIRDNAEKEFRAQRREEREQAQGQPAAHSWQNPWGTSPGKGKGHGKGHGKAKGKGHGKGYKGHKGGKSWEDGYYKGGKGW